MLFVFSKSNAYLPRNFLTATDIVLPFISAVAKSTSPKAPLPISFIKLILALGTSYSSFTPS